MKRSILAALVSLAFASPVMAQQGNQLVCGDASVCPNQRGLNSAGGTITNSAVGTLDFWYGIGGASSAMTVSAAAPLSTISGVSLTMRMQRTAANADTSSLFLGQVLDTDQSTFLQGKNVCLSFDSIKGADFSAALAAFKYRVYTGTGTTQGFASMTAGTWTGSNTVVDATVTAQTLPQTSSTCFQMPANATEVGVAFLWTPVGTAAAADYLQFAKIQLAVVNPAGPGPVNAPPYNFASKVSEYERAFRRLYVINEPAASVNVAANGVATSATNCAMSLQFLVTMRAAPTLTASTVTSGTTWQALAAGVAANLSAIAVDTANTAQTANFKLTTAGMTAGQSCGLQGKAGGATLTWSADLL